MLAVMPKGCPLFYGHCVQTVTLYHADFAGGDYACRRVVVPRVYLEFKKNCNVDKTGRTEANSFLLVIPQASCRFVLPAEYKGAAGTYTLEPGDKVLLGEGPELPTREAWAALLPAGVYGLAVVQNIDVKYWQGTICHVEAGGA